MLRIARLAGRLSHRHPNYSTRPDRKLHRFTPSSAQIYLPTPPPPIYSHLTAPIRPPEEQVEEVVSFISQLSSMTEFIAGIEHPSIRPALSSPRVQTALFAATARIHPGSLPMVRSRLAATLLPIPEDIHPDALASSLRLELESPQIDVALRAAVDLADGLSPEETASIITLAVSHLRDPHHPPSLHAYIHHAIWALWREPALLPHPACVKAMSAFLRQCGDRLELNRLTSAASALQQ